MRPRAHGHRGQVPARGQGAAQGRLRRGQNGEVWLHNVHIPPYAPATRENHEPERPRKLLMHRREIERLIGKTKEKGLTLVPTRLYFKDRHAKVEIALARGKDIGRQAPVDQGARAQARDGAQLQALVNPRSSGPARDDPLRVQLVVGRVVVALDLVQRERLRDVRLVEEVGRVAEQVRVLDQPRAVAAEVRVVDGVEAQQRRQQAPVGLGDRVAGQVAAVGQQRLEPVERGEDTAVGLVVGLLRAGEAGAVDAVLELAVDPVVELVDLARACPAGRGRRRPTRRGCGRCRPTRWRRSRPASLSHRTGTVTRPS